MIDAKDIRIGDYLYYYDEDERKNLLVKITCIDDTGWGFFEFILPPDERINMEGWCKNLDPIPLTIDVLIHSDFEFQEQGGDRMDLWTGFGEDNQHDIEIQFDGDKPFHLKIDGPVYLVTTHIEYVHQLQHFLRDCKTGKEIEL